MPVCGTNATFAKTYIKYITSNKANNKFKNEKEMNCSTIEDFIYNAFMTSNRSKYKKRNLYIHKENIYGRKKCLQNKN